MDRLRISERISARSVGRRPEPAYRYFCHHMIFDGSLIGPAAMYGTGILPVVTRPSLPSPLRIRSAPGGGGGGRASRTGTPAGLVTLSVHCSVLCFTTLYGQVQPDWMCRHRVEAQRLWLRCFSQSVSQSCFTSVARRKPASDEERMEIALELW